MQNLIKQEISKTRAVVTAIENDSALQQTAEDIARCCIASLKNGGKIMFAGNGGSAADSQHLAAELVSRLCYDRPGLAAVALTTDTSALTAIGNDYSYENLFSRQIEAIGQKGDVIIVFSTSGKSPNILKALDAARAKGITTVGFSGQSAPLMAERCEWLLAIPSRETPKIQECHIMMGHIICALIEEEIFGEQYNPKRAKTVTA
jgi:D-sedoheptulose 7-phosphate isomerase